MFLNFRIFFKLIKLATISCSHIMPMINYWTFDGTISHRTACYAHFHDLNFYGNNWGLLKQMQLFWFQFLNHMKMPMADWIWMLWRHWFRVLFRFKDAFSWYYASALHDYHVQLLIFLVRNMTIAFLYLLWV